ISSLLLPPPPLIAPTPSNVRPPDEPLMVIEASAWAGTAATVVATTPPATSTAPVSTAVDARERRQSRLSLDTMNSFRGEKRLVAAVWAVVGTATGRQRTQMLIEFACCYSVVATRLPAGLEGCAELGALSRV